MTKETDQETDYPPPERRYTITGHQKQELSLRRLLAQDALNNGWMIKGASGIGKATLAYRLARAVLSPASEIDPDTFSVNPETRTARLVEQKAHPDLLVAERQWDEKKQRYLTDISVENIRSLISSFGQTSESGRRIAIIDTADDLNRNAANALLKILEEPPKGALLLLLVNSPGRLLPTIRSRCRVINLNPVPDSDVIAFLTKETDLDTATVRTLVEVAEGRPGYALRLANSDGKTAIDLVQGFFDAISGDKGVSHIADRLSPKAAEATWDCFRMVLLQNLSRAIREQAVGKNDSLHGLLAHAPVSGLVRLWEELNSLIGRSEALNTDRGQLILAMGIRTRAILNGAP